MDSDDIEKFMTSITDDEETAAIEDCYPSAYYTLDGLRKRKDFQTWSSNILRHLGLNT